MPTNTDLIAEAKKLPKVAFAGKHALRLLPQLTDALAAMTEDASQAKGEAASMKAGIDALSLELQAAKAERENWHGKFTAMVQVEATLRGHIATLEAGLAKARQRAIVADADPRIMMCHLCGVRWFKGDRETHPPADCPMEG